jgi:hypothetical protein
MSRDDIEAMALFDGLWEVRMVRVDAQLARIDGTAYWLGKQLTRHEVTPDDVNRRLTAMTAQRHFDDETWVPWYLAEETAAAALRRGMEVRS